MNDTLLLYSLAWITQRLYIDGYCCYFLWLMAYLSALLILLSFLYLRLPPLPFSSPTPPSIPPLYIPLLCRPQAGDDLRLLEDGLAGELLQYCHDHQAGGGGQGRFPFPLSCDLSKQPVKMDGGNVFLELPLSFTIYQDSCCAPCCGRKWLPLSDHEWSPFPLVAVIQGQSFDVYEGSWRNIVASDLLTVLASVEYSRLLF